MIENQSVGQWAFETFCSGLSSIAHFGGRTVKAVTAEGTLLGNGIDRTVNKVTDTFNGFSPSTKVALASVTGCLLAHTVAQYAYTLRGIMFVTAAVSTLIATQGD